MSSKVQAGFLDMWVTSLGGYDIWDLANVISRYCRILTLDVARLFLSGIQPKRCLQLCEGLRFSKRIAQNPHLWLSNKKHYQVIHVKICCKLLNLPYNWDQTYHNFNRGSEHVVLPLLLIQRLQKGMTQSRLTPIRIPDYGGGNRLGEGSTAQCCNDCYCSRFCVDSFLMYIFFLSFF